MPDEQQSIRIITFSSQPGGGSGSSTERRSPTADPNG
jgi:hypothetical protein